MKFILTKKEKQKAERLQKKYRKEFRKHSPASLWIQLRMLFSDRSEKQAFRDKEFIEQQEQEESHEEDHGKRI